MSKTLALLGLIFLVACEAPSHTAEIHEAADPNTRARDLVRYALAADSTVCYRVIYENALSCV